MPKSSSENLDRLCSCCADLVTSHGSRAVHKDRPVRNAFDQVGLAEAVQKAFGEAVLFEYFFNFVDNLLLCAYCTHARSTVFLKGKLKRFCFQYGRVEVGDAIFILAVYTTRC